MENTFLDRDLLTFLSAIPREQHVRPDERRSLLRRALAGIVPAEILTRRRKAYVARHSVKLIDTAFPAIEHLLRCPYAVEAQWVNAEPLRSAVRAARGGELKHTLPLRRTLALELWLHQLAQSGLLA